MLEHREVSSRPQALLLLKLMHEDELFTHLGGAGDPHIFEDTEAAIYALADDSTAIDDARLASMAGVGEEASEDGADEDARPRPGMVASVRAGYGELVRAIIRPPRTGYTAYDLGPDERRLHSQHLTGPPPPPLSRAIRLNLLVPARLRGAADY